MKPPKTNTSRLAGLDLQDFQDIEGAFVDAAERFCVERGVSETGLLKAAGKQWSVLNRLRRGDGCSSRTIRDCAIAAGQIVEQLSASAGMLPEIERLKERRALADKDIDIAARLTRGSVSHLRLLGRIGPEDAAKLRAFLEKHGGAGVETPGDSPDA